MDMLMIDINSVDCNEGDEVIIFDEEKQTAEDFSKYSVPSHMRFLPQFPKE